jgi:GNAT superfamily N-acetyltransferase
VSDTDFRIREGTAADLSRVRPLWEALYEHQRAHGLLAEVAADGFDRWAAALTTVLGRFGCLFVAQSAVEPVGFLAGRVRAPTPPFGPAPVGFISEVFVAQSRRGTGAGRRLIEAATVWFAAQGVARLELQVLVGNTAARDAYLRLGWREELVQMVCPIRGPGG